jgi:hypothetical protein
VARNVFICRDELASSREVCSVDTGATQRSGMHACPTGSYLRGVDVSQNHFTCCHDAGPAPTLQPRNEIVDTSTQDEGMHTCGSARFMTGFHNDQNLVLCDTQ